MTGLNSFSVLFMMRFRNTGHDPDPNLNSDPYHDEDHNFDAERDFDPDQPDHEYLIMILSSKS